MPNRKMERILGRGKKGGGMSKKIIAIIAVCFLLFQCLLWLLIYFAPYFTGLTIGLLLGGIAGMVLVTILYTLCLKSWDKLINDSGDITEVLKKLLCIHGLSDSENSVIIQEAERKLDKLYDARYRNVKYPLRKGKCGFDTCVEKTAHCEECKYFIP
jgi:hypothetical protein